MNTRTELELAALIIVVGAIGLALLARALHRRGHTPVRRNQARFSADLKSQSVISKGGRDEPDDAEQFAADAALAEQEALATHNAVPLDAAFDYLSARIAGQRAREPRPTPWRKSQ